MAERKRMTAEEVVSYLLEGEEGLDFLRESLRWVVQQLMEAEVSELIGAEHGERNPERLAHRNGYRPRRWDTRAGELELRDSEDQTRQLLPKLPRAAQA
jgi:putative transposase